MNFYICTEQRLMAMEEAAQISDSLGSDQISVSPCIGALS